MTLTVTPTVNLASTPPSVSLQVTDSTGATSSATITRFVSGGSSNTVRTSDGGPLPLTATGTAVVRTNLVTNPSFETAVLGSWTASAGTGGAVTTSVPATGGLAGAPGTHFARASWTTATTSVSGGWQISGLPVTVGTAYTASAWLRSSKAQKVTAQIVWLTSASAVISTSTSAVISLTAATAQQISVTATAPATATQVRLQFFADPTGTNWASGNTLDIDGAMLEASSTLGTYFDGDTVDTAADTYAWTGTASASTSTDTPSVSKAATLVDNEAPYGVPVQYSLDGGATLTAPVTVAVTRPWLTHPFTPGLSMQITLRPGSLTTETRPVAQGVFQPLGRKNPIVITDGTRKGAQSQVVVLTHSTTEFAALKSLLADSAPLLLNIPASLDWGFNASYIAVGDHKPTRVQDRVIESWRDNVLTFYTVDSPVSGTASTSTTTPTGTRTWADLGVERSTWSNAATAYSTWAKAEAGTPG